MNRFAVFVLASALPLAAGRIDVTSQTFAAVHQGASILIDFSVWNYGVNNPGFSPYPTSLGLDLIVQNPAVDSGDAYLLQGWIESLDGAFSTPLYGAGGGPLLLAPGVFDSAGTPQLPVGVISGRAAFASPEALFGSDFAARIVLTNLGPELTLGIGPGYTVRNTVFVNGVTGAGPRSVGGITGAVTVANPEPSTWILTAGAAALLFVRRLRSPGARVRTPSRSRV